MPLSLKKGDIVVVKSDGFIQSAIRWRTRGRGEAPTRVNHVGLITEVRYAFNPTTDRYDQAVPFITESLVSEGTTKRKLSHYVGNGAWVGIYRARNISDAQRARIAGNMEAFIGKRYGKLKIGLHLVGLQALCFWDARPICSYAAAVSYGIEGLSFGRVGPGAATPDDIDDFVQNREYYEEIKPLGPLTAEEVGA